MSMQLVISASAQSLGLANPMACIFRNVRNDKALSPALDPDVKDVMSRMDSIRAKINSPEVQGFRELFKTMGYPTLTPAGERLVTIFGDKEFKRINPIVDSYNIACLESISGLGMHDANYPITLGADIVVRRSDGTDKILPMFKKKPEIVKTGDLVYGYRKDGQEEVMAWLGEKDVDSDRHKVTEKTTTLVFIVLGNARTSAEYNTEICLRTFGLLQKVSPGVSMEMLPVRHETEASSYAMAAAAASPMQQ